MRETTGTPIGRAARRAVGDDPAVTGIYALQDPQEAFAARVMLARVAEWTLDVQYYIWHPDTSGSLLLEELWSAADRGVRVRVLLDDNGTAGLDPAIATLDAHPRIELRLFNPFPNRRIKTLGYLTDFKRLNRRMHNKSFTADGAATIVGGRNVGDEYFGAGRGTIFADLDVLAVGPVAAEVVAAFEQYWEDPAVERAATVVGTGGPETVAAARERWGAVARSPEAARYLEAVRETPLVTDLVDGTLQIERARAHLVCDPPGKVRDRAPDAAFVFAQLAEAFGAPARSIDIVSPYFVPGATGTEALAQFARSGLALRILTNSLAATDVAAVHAGYAKRRKPLLEAGARLYELMPVGLPPRRLGRRNRRRAVGSSRASLHAKIFAIDRTRAFVGSLNLDPRSVRLNTEMGLLIDSPSLARMITDDLDSAPERSAYEVVLEGGRLAWIERAASGTIRYRDEPKTSAFRRLGVRLLETLPIEWLL